MLAPASERVGGIAASFVLIAVMAHSFMHETWRGSLVLGLIGVVAAMCSWGVDRWSNRRRDRRQAGSR